jgi:hypothetical protein
MLLLFAVSSAFGGTILRECYGTVFGSDLERIDHFKETGDTAALQEMHDGGWMTVFKVGEKVEVEESTLNPDLRKVRRPGDAAKWYILMQCVSFSH